jgi:PAS domain S-box-containing protein
LVGRESVSAMHQSRRETRINAPPPQLPRSGSSLRRWSALRRYGYAVIAITLATLARVALDHWFSFRHQYSAFYLAVLFSAWYGGIGPALVAIALGAAAVILLAVGVLPGASSTLIGFEFFFIVTLTGAILLEAQRRTVRLAAESAQLARDRMVQLELETAQRKRAEESARSAEEQLRITLENAPVGICRIALDGTFLEVNPQFLEITGYSSEELLHRYFRETSDEEDVIPRLQYLARSGECDPPFCQEESRHVRKDGSVRMVAFRMSFARDPNGRLQYAVGVLGDVTEQRRAEEHLRKAQQMESVGLLAGGIAHDFNNLLTSVLGNAILAVQAVPTDSAMHGMLESIIASGERAAHLTGQLLAYAGKGMAWPGLLDLSEMVREAVELVFPSIPGEIKIHTDLKDRLPPLYADGSQIVQLITNLLMNSAEAIEDRAGVITISTDLLTVPEGEPLPVAAVGEVQPGTFLLLRVQDTGAGIDGAPISRIFDPFFTTKFTGRGLGLAAVAGIVRQNQGAVLVSSTPGKGTAMTVLLPVTSELPGSAEPPTREPGRAEK